MSKTLEESIRDFNDSFNEVVKVIIKESKLENLMNLLGLQLKEKWKS